MNGQATLPGVDDAPRKPDGGFRFISVIQLAMAWWAYREGFIRFCDLRVYVACHELVSKRCDTREGIAPRFGLGEIQALTGVPTRKLKSSLSRLVAAGLLRWSES